MRPSCPHRLKCDSSEKTTCWQSACQALCSFAHCRLSHRWLVVKRILYKDTLARNQRCSRHRRIHEVDISTPVAVDQRAANCRAIHYYGHSPLRGAGVDRRALTSPSVVHCQFFELFGARRSTASKLTSLWNCSAAPELLLRDRKIPLLEGRF
ncbi:uncharacterized protein TNCV_975461 [Trichonephila clavipes]|nr:uncharacterized protein TNCV_975461 [Trichonephila clavipes]